MRAGTYGFVRRVYGRAFGLERYFRNWLPLHLHFTERNFWTIATGRESFNFLKIVKKASIVFRLFDCHFHNSCVTILDHACVCTAVLVRISSCRFGRVVYLQNLQSHVFCEFSLFFLSRKRGKSNQWNECGKWCENCWHKRWVNRCTTLCQTTAEKSSFWLLLR